MSMLEGDQITNGNNVSTRKTGNVTTADQIGNPGSGTRTSTGHDKCLKLQNSLGTDDSDYCRGWKHYTSMAPMRTPA